MQNSENKMKWVPFFAGIGFLNCISGPVSIMTPAMLGLINFYIPFTD